MKLTAAVPPPPPCLGAPSVRARPRTPAMLSGLAPVIRPAIARNPRPEFPVRGRKRGWCSDDMKLEEVKNINVCETGRMSA